MMLRGFVGVRSFVIFLCAASAWAQVEVTSSCPWVDRDGYTPVIVTLRADLPTTVELKGSFDEAHATMSVTVPAGTTLRRTVLVPSSGRQWMSSPQLSWRAPGQPPGSNYLSPKRFREFDVVVLDPADAYGVKELRDAVSRSIGSPPDPDNASRSSTATPYPDERFTRWSSDVMPERWQGYPAWITLIITPAGERALNEAQRGAISAWTTAGGALFVTDAAQVARWATLGARVQVVTESALRQRITSVWSRVARTIDAVPVPGTSVVPVYGFITIAVLFAIVVGPANLWWCVRQRRRHLLLVTTPLLSLAASVALLLYGLFADGFTVRRVVVQVLALDQTTARASVWTGLTLFAGLPPSSLALDDDAMLMRLNVHRRQVDLPMVALEWRDDGQLARGGWVPARSNQHLGLGLATTDKRRLTFTRHGDLWTVANGFEQPLVAITWIDGGGRAWHLQGLIAPGQASDLLAGSGEHLTMPLQRLPGAAEQAVEAIQNSVELTAGTYHAQFAGPLSPIPGPAASDALPVQTWVVGRVLASSAVTTATPYGF